MSKIDKMIKKILNNRTVFSQIAVAQKWCLNKSRYIRNLIVVQMLNIIFSGTLHRRLI